MHDRVLRQMREKIRTRQYVMTVHAEEEMTDDNMSIFDVEHVILTGEIIERQKDRDRGDWKYLVESVAEFGKWGHDGHFQGHFQWSYLSAEPSMKLGAR